MKRTSLATFYSQLAHMLDAGLPMIQALDGLAQRSPPRLRTALKDMSLRISKGSNLSDAFAAQDRMLPPEDLGMVRAAEASGRLEAILHKMAETHESLVRMGKQIAARLVYPAIMVHVAIFALAILQWAIRRSIADSLSFAATSFGLLYGGAFVAYLLLFSERRIMPLRRALDRLIQVLPVASGLCRSLAMARFARMFQSLYVAGIGHQKAVELAADGCGNTAMATQIKRSVPLLASGSNLTQALGTVAVFDPTVIAAIATGEQSGRIEETFGHLAKMFDENAEQKLAALTTIIPTVLYLMAALGVAIFVVRFWAGYFDRLQSIMGP